MKDGTLRQASKILSLFENTPGEQVQALLGSGLLADLRDANIAEINRDSFRRHVGLSPLNPPLLEEIGTITIPSTTEPFTARERFLVDMGEKARVKISYLGGNFEKWFLGKIEEPAEETALRYAKLTKSSVDGPIMAELGDAKETTLTAIYALMERQKNGEEGALLTNGRANVFYVWDVNGVLRAVCVYWCEDGWYVRAHSVSDPLRWCVGDQVFSCNSSVPVTV